MRLWLVRHGQCEWQLTRSGDLDSQLTDIGHEQAAITATWFAQHGNSESRFDAVLTSPLQRARVTAEFIARALEIAVVSEPALAEAPFRVSTCAPASTQYLAFKTQVIQALNLLRARAENNQGAVLAVSHGGVISTLLRVMAESDHIGCKVGNGAISLFEWKDSRWHLSYLNAQEHLPPRLRTT